MDTNRKLRIGRASLVGVLTCVLVPVAASGQTIILENAQIIPVSSAPIKKGSILIKDGKIVEFGSQVEAPFNARAIDCTGKVLFPGMVDVHTARGLDQPNESPPVTPFLNVYDAIDPAQLFFEDSLRDGVTSIHVIHGNDCVIGGISRVVHPIGMTPEEMTTAPDVAIKISLSPKGGYDRMLQLATIREAFAKLDEDMKKLAEKRYEDTLRDEGKDLDVPPAEEQKRGQELIRDEDIDEKDRNLLRLSRGRVGAFLYCGSAMDVGAAERIAKKYGFFDKSVFVLGPECHKAVAELKKLGRPVVLDAELVHRETDPLTGDEKETFVPKVIDRAGLKFALQRQGFTTLGERYLWYQAARCVREGISRERALKAVTLWPAEMLGLGDRLGSIEKGKDANIVVLTGDPLDAQTWVERVFIQGEPVYDRASDIRLRELFKSPVEEEGPSGKGGPTTVKEADPPPTEVKTDDTPRPRGRRPRGEGPPRRRPRPPADEMEDEESESDSE